MNNAVTLTHASMKSMRGRTCFYVALPLRYLSELSHRILDYAIIEDLRRTDTFLTLLRKQSDVLVAHTSVGCIGM